MNATDAQPLFSLVSSIPKYILLPILTEWLDLSGVTKFDSSLCLKSTRDSFLKNIIDMTFHGFRGRCACEGRSSFEHVGFDYMEQNTIISAVDWMKIRKIKVDHVLITKDSLSYAVDHMDFSKLTSLCLALSYPSLLAFKVIPDESILTLINNCPKLTAVNVSQGGDLVISEASLLNIIRWYPEQLLTLVIGYNAKLSTKSVVQSIIENQKCLTCLHISASKVLEDSDIELLSFSCRGLTDLDISGNRMLTAKRSAMAIVNNLFLLKAISFDQKSIQTNAQMFRVLRRGFEKIINLDLLRHIAIGIPLRERQVLTNEDVVKEINSVFRPVELSSDPFNLNEKVHFMPSCGEVDTVAMPKHVFGFVLDTFIWHCSSHIRELNIRGFPVTAVGRLDPKNDLTNSSLFIMASKCKLLESVDFSYRECITDDGMSALLFANKRMVRVCCEYCTNVGSGTISAVSAYCEKLEVLSMSGCRDINDECLIQLAHGCRLLTHLGLKHLDTQSTKSISIRSMGLLVERCKGLQYIYRTMPELSFSIKQGFHGRSYGQQSDNKTSF